MTESAKGLNCHFVSRFLTKPWEFGQRRLHYYDFGEEVIRQRSSRSLFAMDGAHSQEVEDRLNQLIETPLSQAMSTLAGDRDATEPLKIEDWQLYRALLLLLPIQGARAGRHIDEQGLLEETLFQSEEELNQEAQYWDQMYQIIRVGSPGFMLHYPSTGLFSFPVFIENKGYSFSLCMPLTPRQAIIMIPREFDADAVLLSARTGAYLSNFSVGAGEHCRQVVIHPEVIQRFDKAVIGSAIKGARHKAEDIIKNARRVNDLADKAFKIAGLRPPDRW